MTIIPGPLTIPALMAEIEDFHATTCEALEIVAELETATHRGRVNARKIADLLKDARDISAELIQRYEESNP